MKRFFLSLGFGLLAAGLLPLSSQAVVVFDNISSIQDGATGAAAIYSSSTPNTFMGDAYTLTPGTTSITGFDLYPLNATGTTYVDLKLTVYVWGSVNTTGTVNATTPAFSNLLNSYTLTAPGNFTSGSYYYFESSSPGVTPGISLTTPLTISSNTVGLTFAYQGSTDGTTYSSANNLTSVIATGPAPTVGSDVFNGYYRNVNSETNGNFTAGLRSLNGYNNQTLAVRVYGNVSAVPEPGTWAMLALGVAGLLIWRKRTATA